MTVSSAAQDALERMRDWIAEGRPLCQWPVWEDDQPAIDELEAAGLIEIGLLSGDESSRPCIRAIRSNAP